MSYQRKKKRVDISVEARKVKVENVVVAIQFQRKKSDHGSFFDIKTAKIDRQTVSLFGIFDDHGDSCATEYLKEHLFESLMKHPKFITETKLAISECKFFTFSESIQMICL